ncbi:MAG: glycosyltransferase involved in cell wall biosynthesis [Bacteroidia bacterium]|jgi:glycosyltransferase involved in cell wall biosynthesis
MKRAPLVSVLMPAFNTERFISEAIQSILNQTYQNWELLILNDGSTDDTESIARSFTDPRIIVHSQNINVGYLESCNKLFNLVKGDFVTFLDSDDTCSNDRVSSCLNKFATEPKLDFSTTNFTRCNEVTIPVYEDQSNIDYAKYASDSNYNPMVCCATIFLRAELLKKIGGYHSFFKEIGGEDYHWLFKLSRVGLGKHLDKTLYNYRTHSAQTHHLNENPLKYFVSDIEQEIRAAIIAGEEDPLNDENKLKARWLAKIQTNESELGFRKASSMLNRNQFKKALIINYLTLLNKPFSFTSWHRFAYLAYSTIVRWAR